MADLTIQVCPHQGKPCDGAHYCEVCKTGPLREGYCFEEDADARCKDCEPKNLFIRDVFCATWDEMYQESEKHGGNIAYMTDWPVEDDCDCCMSCPCRMGKDDSSTIGADDA